MQDETFIHILTHKVLHLFGSAYRPLHPNDDNFITRCIVSQGPKLRIQLVDSAGIVRYSRYLRQWIRGAVFRVAVRILETLQIFSEDIYRESFDTYISTRHLFI